MTYNEFIRNFGSSFRTRNVRRLRGQTWLDRAFGSHSFSLARGEGLPKEFIRLDPWEAEYLFCIARRARKGIVEIGRLQGGSTFLLACANPRVQIYSIDIAPRDDEQLNRLFAQHHVGQNVNLIVGDSRQEAYDSVGEFDVLFIDGDHSYQGCRADLDKWFRYLSQNGHVIVHDSFLDKPVQDAVADFIEQNSSVQVVIWPFIGASYWNYPAGSVAHLIKR